MYLVGDILCLSSNTPLHPESGEEGDHPPPLPQTKKHTFYTSKKYVNKALPLYPSAHTVLYSLSVCCSAHRLDLRGFPVWGFLCKVRQFAKLVGYSPKTLNYANNCNLFSSPVLPAWLIRTTLAPSEKICTSFWVRLLIYCNLICVWMCCRCSWSCRTVWSTTWWPSTFRT